MSKVKALYVIPAALWMVVIWVFSSDMFSASQTGSVVQMLLAWLMPWSSEALRHGIHMGLRKSAHVFTYGVLSTFYMVAFQGRWRAFSGATRRQLGLAFVLAVLWACVDEYRQSLSAHRTGTLVDVGYDALGAALALIIGRVGFTRKRL